MTSKMISVKEEIYHQLEKLKFPGETFSELLERLIKNQRKDPLKHFGIAKETPKEILDEFENAVLNAKKESAKNAKNRFNELWGE